MGPKSILKKSTSSYEAAASSGEFVGGQSLQYVNLNQRRSDIELQILAALELLIELPSVANADSRRPSDTDESRFIELVQLFQQSDLDLVSEERNAADRCGYVFCPRAPRKLDGSYKIVRSSVSGRSRIATKHEIELWCSDECAQLAAYVREQLPTEPAWLRGSHSYEKLKISKTFDRSPTLFGEGSGQTDARLAHISHNFTNDMVQNFQALALERGPDPPVHSNRVPITPQVRENLTSNDKSAYTGQFEHIQTSSTAIEGYEPRVSSAFQSVR